MDRMNEYAVGIDVSKLKLDICVASSAKMKTKVVKNSPAGHQQLLDWLAARKLPAETPVVLEATGPYSESVAIVLADAGWPVSIINPARVKGFAQSELSRNKTDQADARLLARFAQRAELTLWQPPSLAERELRALVERLHALQAMHQQGANRLEAFAQGAPSRVSDMVKEHMDWLKKETAKIEKEIDDHIDGNPELKEDAELTAASRGAARGSQPSSWLISAMRGALKMPRPWPPMSASPRDNGNRAPRSKDERCCHGPGTPPPVVHSTCRGW
jgi:transposase